MENGTVATISTIAGENELTLQTHGAHEREVSVNTSEFNSLRLTYSQYVYEAQSATVNHAFVLTGGWQTDRERAYVALSSNRPTSTYPRKTSAKRTSTAR